MMAGKEYTNVAKKLFNVLFKSQVMDYKEILPAEVQNFFTSEGWKEGRQEGRQEKEIEDLIAFIHNLQDILEDPLTSSEELLELAEKKGVKELDSIMRSLNARLKDTINNRH